jgi:hypothetical protein
VIKTQLVAQHAVDGIGQRGTLSRAKIAMVTEKLGDDSVGWVVKFEGQPNEFGAGF